MAIVRFNSPGVALLSARIAKRSTGALYTGNGNTLTAPGSITTANYQAAQGSQGVLAVSAEQTSNSAAIGWYDITWPADLTTADDYVVLAWSTATPIVNELDATAIGYWNGTDFLAESAPATSPAGAALATQATADSILEDTGTTLPTAISGISSGSNPTTLISTTIATLASQTSFTLTAGSADNDAYNGAVAVFTDVSTANQKSFVKVLDYVGATKTVTLSAAPKFTIAATDSIAIVAGIASDVTVTPVLSTVSSGEVAGDDITIYQGETKAFVFTLTTDAGVAIDESGDTLKLVVRHVTTAAQIFEVTGTVGGASNNQITVTVDGQYTVTPQTYRYELWNVTEDVVRARGAFLIVKAGQPT